MWLGVCVGVDWEEKWIFLRGEVADKSSQSLAGYFVSCSGNSNHSEPDINNKANFNQGISWLPTTWCTQSSQPSLLSVQQLLLPLPEELHPHQGINLRTITDERTSAITCRPIRQTMFATVTSDRHASFGRILMVYAIVIKIFAEWELYELISIHHLYQPLHEAWRCFKRLGRKWSWVPWIRPLGFHQERWWEQDGLVSTT